jgi:hypothetical protein
MSEYISLVSHVFRKASAVSIGAVAKSSFSNDVAIENMVTVLKYCMTYYRSREFQGF